jgi:hypothetical protein
VLPASQQRPAHTWGSHKTRAQKALAKLAGPHLPASLKAIERAVTRAEAEHRDAVTAAPRDPQPAPDDNDIDAPG